MSDFFGGEVVEVVDEVVDLGFEGWTSAAGSDCLAARMRSTNVSISCFLRINNGKFLSNLCNFECQTLANGLGEFLKRRQPDIFRMVFNSGYG